ncbi:MAG: tripartite tricarboxylate transporter substrate binding protein [Alphaproteobacteria bacterium]|nr:tripartite tricarboxylate transporter substrate binding protein [Alphaproteobacteria bacterium]
MLVGFPAGGANDVAARTFLPFVEHNLPGASFVVLNRPGGGGAVAAAELARAQADGYTLGFIGMPTLVSRLHDGRASYTLDGFTFIASLVADPVAFVVAAASPIRRLSDLIERARRDPRALAGGTLGVGGAQHLAILQLERATGIQLSHVPFTGSAPVRAAVQGGHTAFAALSLSDAGRLIQEGKLRGLAVAAEQRLPALPDLPTCREQGLDLLAASTRGVAAPRGLLPAIRARLETALKRAVEDPDYRAQSDAQFVTVSFQDSGRYEAFIRAEHARLGRLWAEAPWLQR